MGLPVVSMEDEELFSEESGVVIRTYASTCFRERWIESIPLRIRSTLVVEIRNLVSGLRCEFVASQ
ncbi:hypothetical protein M3Y98_01021700 [Aphelenchoides besseyi]|nr:hypothetical protein M3Y98_01021700 [Aphelenchoides besseyi]